MTTTFRDSQYIDFNVGEVKIAPMELWSSLTTPLQLLDKIRLFACRVDIWQLGVAVQLLNEIESHQPPSIWSHSTYGMMAIGFTYFEMLGKTLNPNSAKSRTAGEDFNSGFCDVYSEYTPTSSNYDDSNVPTVKEFRNRVRNGMYHLAYTKKNLLIRNDQNTSTKDFAVIQHADGTENVDVFYVNPHSMVRTIVDHFPSFIDRLNNSDSQFDTMRRKFTEYFDDYHDT